MLIFVVLQVTRLKIYTNQFAAAFRKRSATPPEIAKKIHQIKSDGQQLKAKKSGQQLSRSARMPSTSSNSLHSPSTLIVKSEEDKSPKMVDDSTPNGSTTTTGLLLLFYTFSFESPLTLSLSSPCCHRLCGERASSVGSCSSVR